MPIAKDFFKTYLSILSLSENPWVLVGSIVNYICATRRVGPEEAFHVVDNIESLHSEIEENLLKILPSYRTLDDEESFRWAHLCFKAYTELVFLFAAVINEIQDGPVSEPHRKLVEVMGPEDSVITFNWDTLLDRSLFEGGGWKPDFGYGFSPKSIFDKDAWRASVQVESYFGPRLIKLHGSSNWITGAITERDGKFVSTQSAPTNSVSVFQSSVGPYATYDGRWARDYQPFSYGYYPPNLDDEGIETPKGFKVVRANLRGAIFPKKGPANDKGLVSMPLIIPPVKKKSYDFYGDLFTNLWKEAEDALVNANAIIMIGYSFPVTDIQSKQLFLNALARRKAIPSVVIVNPEPDRIVDLLKIEFGIPDTHIRVFREYFSEDFSIRSLIQS